ncbi:FkbM family methyltransferase [Siccirubricoccus phaeus]|uniref:FkbM family methyltransferase n=1 Tax=Siccirubricoccus phaeus TaxID=2595053 RepID=UPI00165B59F1|nr:FkbM family methyltransferase [Siccirubricoccus phaeus]
MPVNAAAPCPPPAEWFRFRLTWSWVEHVWKSVILHDHAVLRPLLQELLPEDGVAIDIGAHGGQVTWLLAALTPRGQVVAVEPSSYARAVLRAALALRPRRNVLVVAAALGTAASLGVLATPVKRAGAMGYGLASLAPDPARAVVREVVPIVTLDALAAALGLTRLDVLKLDVEGHEGAVLAGAEAVLARFRPAILLEIDDARLRRAGGSAAQLRAFLAARGYAGQPLRAGTAAEADGDWLYRPAA